MLTPQPQLGFVDRTPLLEAHPELQEVYTNLRAIAAGAIDCWAEQTQPCTLPPSQSWDRSDWEARRGVKEWLSGQLPPGRSYKPTVQQLRMTQGP